MTNHRKNKMIDVVLFDLSCTFPHYNRYLLSALRSVNPHVELCTTSFSYDPKYFDKYAVPRMSGMIDYTGRWRISSRRLKRGFKLIEYLLNWLIFWKLSRAKNIDIVHIQSLPLATHSSIELTFLNCIKRQGARIVYTVHNILPHDTGLKFKDRYAKIYRFMDMLICHTHEAKEQLITMFALSADKICVIPHGPMFHEYADVKGDILEFIISGENQRVVLFLGTIHPYKGVEFLLDSWKKVTLQCHDARLVIAGSGEHNYIEQLKRKIESLGLTQTVITCFRFLENEEIPKLINRADILVYPYKAITQSGALLTGMAFGKPIVASSIGGLKETLGNGKFGVLVEYGNTDDLAAALIDLINSPEKRMKLGDAALSELNANFSWESIAEKTMLCYSKALSR